MGLEVGAFSVGLTASRLMTLVRLAELLVGLGDADDFVRPVDDFVRHADDALEDKSGLLAPAPRLLVPPPWRGRPRLMPLLGQVRQDPGHHEEGLFQGVLQPGFRGPPSGGPSRRGAARHCEAVSGHGQQALRR